MVVFITVQKLLHREIQSVLLLIFKRPVIVIAIFSLLLLPGVFIHEASHLISALLLRVPIKKFSILPKPLKNGQLRMGYVETVKTDFVRDSLIGLAPFVVGLLIVGSIGIPHLGLESISGSFKNFDTYSIFLVFHNLQYQNDTGIWLYLVFCISTAMIPSAADRQSWKMIALALGILLFFLLLLGTGAWLRNQAVVRIDGWFSSIAFIILTSAVIHFLILISTWITKLVLSRITGMQIVTK
jgi:hypothetical protein